MLDLHCCPGFALGAATGGLFLVLVTGFSLLWLPSLGAEHGLYGVQASAGVACGLSCSFQALERRLGISSCSEQA